MIAQGASRAAVTRFHDDLGIAMSPETERVGRETLEPRGETAPGRVIPERGVAHLHFATSATPIATPPALLRPRLVAPDARRCYLEARRFSGDKSPITIMKAIDSYERAIGLSPAYAEAHAGLAFALCQAVVYLAYPGNAAWPRAKAHASQAIRLDRRLGEAHAVLAHVSLCYDYDRAQAEALYRKALELDPVSVSSRQLYALYFLTSIGRTDDALATLDRARDDMPDNPGISVYYAISCVVGRQFERGLREVNFVLEGHPALIQAHWVRGMALEGLGDYAGAIRTFEAGVATTNSSSLLLAQLGRACAGAGNGARATSILRELDERGEDSGPAAYFSAEILAALGAVEPALDRVYAAYRQRNPFLVFAGVMYGLDPLRNERRFRDLLMRVGLPAYERRAHAPPSAV